MSRVRVVVLSVFLVFTIFTFPFVSSGEQGYQYINGRLEYIKDNVLVLKVIDEKKEFPLSSKVRYLKHVEENKAIYEKPASQNEVRSGMSVTIRVVAGVVDEIILEEYKK